MNKVKIKICGLTNLDDALCALEAGADLLGFIFYPKSPRAINPLQAHTIVQKIRSLDNKILLVGVFVNETAQHIAQVINQVGLDAAQLHGDEPPEMLGLAKHTGIQSETLLAGRAYKAFSPRSAQEAQDLADRYALPNGLRGQLPAFLIDAYHPQLRGGSGQVGDWETAAQLARQYPILLAGGLTPDNAAQAAAQVLPWGVDVASGVEQSPGRKEHSAVRRFISTLRERTA